MNLPEESNFGCDGCHCPQHTHTLPGQMQCPRISELAVPTANAADLRNVFSRRIVYLDAVVAAVRDINLACRVNRNAVRISELPVLIAIAAPLACKPQNAFIGIALACVCQCWRSMMHLLCFPKAAAKSWTAGWACAASGVLRWRLRKELAATLGCGIVGLRRRRRHVRGILLRSASKKQQP